MTVAVQTPTISYLENGSTTVFAVPFRYDSPADLRATRLLASGAVVTLVNGTDFTATPGPTNAGGTVTLTAAGPAGARLTIFRRTTRNQSADYVPNGPFDAESHERALDKAMLVAQELDQDIARSPKVEPGQTPFSIDPTGLGEGDLFAFRDGKLQRFDAAPFAGKFYAGAGGTGKPVPASGFGADGGLRTDLAGDDGAELVAARKTGSGTVALTLLDKLLRTPEDHGVDYSGSGADTGRLANFFASARTEVFRNGGRQFLGEAAGFNGAWGGYVDYTGLSPLTRSLHNWGPRDAQMFNDSTWGGLCIVGSAQASKAVNWPGHPTFVPSSIGIAGFAINDMPNGQAWGGYADCVRTAGNGAFSVAFETAFANFADESIMSPYNVVDGSARGGVGLWVQTGAGLDLVEGDLVQYGLSSRDVNHQSAHAVFLSSYQQLGVALWANSTAYAVGAKRRDPVTDIIWQCKVAHTSPASGTLTADRMANPSHWKQIPAAYSGIIFAESALAESLIGSDIYSAIEFPERYQTSWWRRNGSGVREQSATMYADRIPDGSAVVPLVFQQGQIWSNAKWAGDADGTTGAKIQARGSGSAVSFEWTGSDIRIYVDNTLVKTI